MVTGQLADCQPAD